METFSQGKNEKQLTASTSFSFLYVKTDVSCRALHMLVLKTQLVPDKFQKVLIFFADSIQREFFLVSRAL